MRTATLLLAVLLAVSGCAGSDSDSGSTSTPTTTTTTPSVAANVTTTPTTSTSPPIINAALEAPTWVPGTTFDYAIEYELLNAFRVEDTAGEEQYSDTDTEEAHGSYGFTVIADDLAPHGDGHVVLLDNDPGQPAAVMTDRLLPFPIVMLPACAAPNCTDPVTDFAVTESSGAAWFDNDQVHFPIVVGDTWTSVMHPGEDGSLPEEELTMDSTVLEPITIDSPSGEVEAYPIHHVARIDNDELFAETQAELAEEGGTLDEYYQNVATTTYYAPDLGAIVRVDLHLDYYILARIPTPEGTFVLEASLNSTGGLHLVAINTDDSFPDYTALEVLTFLRRPLEAPTLSEDHVNAATTTSVTATGTPAALFPDAVVKLQVRGAPSSEAVTVPATLTIPVAASGIITVESRLFAQPNDSVPTRVASTTLAVDYITEATEDCSLSTPAQPADCPEVTVPIGVGTATLRLTATLDSTFPSDGTFTIQPPGGEAIEVASSGGVAEYEADFPDDGTWTISFTPDLALGGTSVTYEIEALAFVAS